MTSIVTTLQVIYLEKLNISQDTFHMSKIQLNITLLHSEQRKFCGALTVLSAVGLKENLALTVYGQLFHSA